MGGRCVRSLLSVTVFLLATGSVMVFGASVTGSEVRIALPVNVGPSADGHVDITLGSSVHGPILLDGDGRTLYVHTEASEAGAKPGGVNDFDRVAAATSVAVAPGIDPTMVAAVARPTGDQQLTYNGRALYLVDLPDDPVEASTAPQGAQPGLIVFRTFHVADGWGPISPDGRPYLGDP